LASFIENLIIIESKTRGRGEERGEEERGSRSEMYHLIFHSVPALFSFPKYPAWIGF
jgi:hypothetical protein